MVKGLVIGFAVACFFAAYGSLVWVAEYARYDKQWRGFVAAAICIILCGGAIGLAFEI